MKCAYCNEKDLMKFKSTYDSVCIKCQYELTMEYHRLEDIRKKK